MGSGNLLQELNNRINNFINGQTKPALVFYSGHDTTVGPLMGTLGVVNGWPPYASHVEIELWAGKHFITSQINLRSLDSDNDYFVQVKFNGQSYQLNGCSGVMCPITEFQALVASRIPTDFAKECSVPKKKKMSIH